MQLDSVGAVRRHYFEFLLSPPGIFDMPAMLLASPEVLTAPIYTASVSPSTILVVRHLACGENISAWQPEVELWIHRYGLGNADEADS
jgi:hypothetical protein